MDRKKRIVVLSIAVFLFVLGFICIGIAAIAQDTINRKYINVIGLSSFGFWLLSLFLIIKNFTNMISSEMIEISAKMHNEIDFFSIINMNESPQSLEERFIKAGFKVKQGCLHKREFSFAKDYINYYVIITKDENIITYLDGFLKSIDEDLFQSKFRFHKNNIVYVFFFNRNTTIEELDCIKNVIINQEVSQGLPLDFDTVLPIVYDTTNYKYIIKSQKSKFSIKLLNMALRKFYKIIEYTK